MNMTKIGLRAHDLGCHSPEGLVSTVWGAGFDGMQLVCHKALEGHPEGYASAIGEGELKALAAAARAQQVEISLLGCYRDFANPALHAETRDCLTRHMGYAQAAGSRFIATETALAPLAPAECEARQGFLVDFAREMAAEASRRGLTLLLEMVRNHPFNSPALARRVIDATGGVGIGFIFDAANLLYDGDLNPAREAALVESYLDPAITPFIRVIHLKDLILRDTERVMVPLGEGLIDFTPIRRLIAACPHLVALIREWERAEWAKQDCAFMRGLLR
ncbi:MAG: sugar phosphate isomerase/epimerase [Succinivibrionaceae bacterium]|nr:sugar phosphate isomerase/epimerase [Succinivibrionaceae bacterium]